MAVREIVPGGWASVSPAYSSWWNRMYGGGGLGAERSASRRRMARLTSPYAAKKGTARLRGLGAIDAERHLARILSPYAAKKGTRRLRGLGDDAGDRHLARMLSPYDVKSLRRMRRSGLGLDLGPIAASLPSGGIFDIAKGVIASKGAEKAAKAEEKAAAAQARTARFAAEAASAEAEGATARTKMLLIGGGVLVAGLATIMLLRRRK